ncbi:DNRLRE domain-containing protein, partial [Candidatus Woesearchaeota archaeon]|nr:DNRLRE domain-containing protein [Candidatus Woesearchaeota archaeon]
MSKRKNNSKLGELRHTVFFILVMLITSIYFLQFGWGLAQNVTLNDTVNLTINDTINDTAINITAENSSLENITTQNQTINLTNTTEELIDEFTFSGKIRDADGKAVKTDIEFIDEDGKVKHKITKNQANAQVDKGKYKVRITPENHPIETIELNDVNVSSNITEFVKIDDVPEFDDYVEVYAIDPTSADFTDGTVTVTATGDELYKCKDWNFTEQECYGDWIKLMDLIPGEEYTFTLTPDDPAFAETIQPNASAGTDAFINQNTPTTNFGSQTFLAAGESGGNYAALLVKFNLSHIPSGADITIAKLKLYFYDSPTNPTNTINLSTRRITSSWDESTVNWNTRPSYTVAYSDKITLTNSYGWVEWDVTSGVQTVVNGSSTNYGMAVVPDLVTASTDKRFYSSDYSNSSLRPILEVNYTTGEPPNVSIIWPGNNTQHGDGDAYVAYNVTSNNSIDSCSLIINGGVQDTDNTITKNIRQTFKKTTSINTTYLISVNCTDSTGVAGTSGIITATINTSKADLYGRIKDSQNNDVNVIINFTQNGVTKATSSGEVHAVTLDDGTYNITIVPVNHTISDMTFEGVNISQGFTRIVDIDEPTNNYGFKRIYAIDPTKINFVRAIVKRIASGRDLFKCESWNFSTRTCVDGKWKKIQNLIPGQKYNFTMLANDPGFGEGNDTVIVLDSGDYLINTTQTILANNSGVYDVGVVPLEEIDDTIKEIIVYGHNESSDQNEIKVSDNFTLTGYSSSYSINPTNLSFSNATVTVTAANTPKNKILYKCLDWNFTTQTCYGNWTALRAITPGENYTFMLNSTDPGLAEGNGTFFDGFESNNLSTNNWTNSGTGNDWAVKSYYPYAGTYSVEGDPEG